MSCSSPHQKARVGPRAAWDYRQRHSSRLPVDAHEQGVVVDVGDDDEK